jgi:dihydroorotase-like cyclic amidohydrolase
MGRLARRLEMSEFDILIKGSAIFDATGLIVAPGVIDTHIRDSDWAKAEKEKKSRAQA